MVVLLLGYRMIVGTEWLIEAEGCDQNKLRDESALRGVFARIIDDLGLKAIDSVWHKFEGEGGVTGMVALTESHLACHTYPEHGIATFNLYCCRTRPEWDWETNLKEALEADSVSITKIERGTLYTLQPHLRSNIPEPKSNTAGGDA